MLLWVHKTSGQYIYFTLSSTYYVTWTFYLFGHLLLRLSKRDTKSPKIYVMCSKLTVADIIIYERCYKYVRILINLRWDVIQKQGPLSHQQRHDNVSLFVDKYTFSCFKINQMFNTNIISGFMTALLKMN